MKTLPTLMIGLLISIAAAAQTEKPTTDSLYIVVYTTGPAWDNSKKPGEQPFFKEHSANLGNLRKEGVIKMGARFADKGMIIISAASMVAAREKIFSDPGVVNKLFNADLQKLEFSIMGVLKRQNKG